MSSYGHSYLFFGWHSTGGIEPVLTHVLGRKTKLPSLDGDWHEDYDEPPELEPILDALQSWSREHRQLPALVLEIVSLGLGEGHDYVLRLKTPLFIENVSDGPMYVSIESVPLSKVSKAIEAARRFEDATGLEPALLHVGTDDPK